MRMINLWSKGLVISSLPLGDFRSEWDTFWGWCFSHVLISVLRSAWCWSVVRAWRRVNWDASGRCDCTACAFSPCTTAEFQTAAFMLNSPPCSPSHLLFPLLVPGNLWDGYVVSLMLFSATSGFLRGDFFFFLGFNLAPLSIHFFGFPSGCRKRGEAAVPAGVCSSCKREGCSWEVLIFKLCLSSACQPVLAWRKGVPCWKRRHGTELWHSCTGAVYTHLQEHKDQIALACFLRCSCSFLIQSRAVVRAVLLLYLTAGMCRHCAELHCPLKRRVQRRFNTGLM